MGIDFLKEEFSKNSTPTNLIFNKIVEDVNKIPGKTATIGNVRSWFVGQVQRLNNQKFKNKDNVATNNCTLNNTSTDTKILIKKEADIPEILEPQMEPADLTDSDLLDTDIKEEVETASMSNFSGCYRPGRKHR